MTGTSAQALCECILAGTRRLIQERLPRLAQRSPLPPSQVRLAVLPRVPRGYRRASVPPATPVFGSLVPTGGYRDVLLGGFCVTVAVFSLIPP
jgi:hypothetical protein